ITMAGTAGTTRGGAEERILTRSADLFARFGYNGVSTREIAAAAEVNEVTIYRHFPRKRDLYLAVLSAELQRVHLRGDLLTRVAEARTGRAALAGAFELLSAALVQQPQLLRLLGFSVLELSEDLDPLLRRYLGELVEVVARYLKPWIENGELRTTNAKTLVLTLISIILSRGPLRRVFLEDAADAHSLFDAYAEFCLREPLAGGVAADAGA
ncbi:MAG TPA: TetR/AcrR family transcriptional regulator, partial [Terracidiphilus sp.]|nr:TetR/AcrR family transcriptional regulator [Terracidiphilus sp.]